jgi:hypothetical protein
MLVYICYGHSVYFTVILYRLLRFGIPKICSFGIIFPVWVYCITKNLESNSSAVKIYNPGFTPSGKPREIDDRLILKYDIHKRLGKGAYGIVWKARYRFRESVNSSG